MSPILHRPQDLELMARRSDQQAAHRAAWARHDAERATWHRTHQANQPQPIRKETTTMARTQARTTATGNLGQDPAVKYTPQGKPVVGLSIAATSSHYDKQTGQWVQDGDDLWLRADFWGEEHTHLADSLHKGDRVTVEGVLVRRTFTRRDGTPGEQLELRFPSLLGVIPRAPRQGQPGGQGQQQGGWDAPAGGAAGDPWATQGGDSVPF